LFAVVYPVVCLTCPGIIAHPMQQFNIKNGCRHFLAGRLPGTIPTAGLSLHE
jgi:hypothetical protein